MIARVVTFALDGVEARRVWVEADIRLGLPGFTVVGLADKAVREARERVQAALVNSGFAFPAKRITVNLAPASLRKAGPGFDLPLALALLVASDQLDPAALDALCRGRRALADRRRAVGPRRAGLRGGHAAPRARAHRRPAGRALARRRWCPASTCSASTRCRRRSTSSPAAPSRARGRRPRTTATEPPPHPTSPTCAATTRSSRRSRSPPPAGTTCSSTDRPAPARRCSPAGCRRSSRR